MALGFSFSRSVKFGPLRVNLSTRGVGLSAGVRGARVSVGPRGTYVTLGRGGFRYRAKISDSAPRRRLPEASRSPALEPRRLDGVSDVGAIRTASVAELVEATPDAVLADIQKRVHRIRWFRLYSWVVGIAIIVSLREPNAVLFLAAFSVTAGYFVYRWDRERRTARLIYDVDDDALVQRLIVCNAIGEALAQSASLWHIYSSVASLDTKRNAGAQTLIRRTRIRAVPGALAGIELNVEPWAVPVGPQQLLFLPDRLLVHEHARFAAIPYEQIRASFETTRFIESEVIPPDSRQVATTWRFVNKSGGPDRRFNDNRELPVLEYGELTLRSTSGMTVVLQVSSPIHGQRAYHALLELNRMSHYAPEPSPPPFQVPNNASYVLPVQPVAGRGISVVPMVGLLLRYIAAADGRITEDEIQYATGVLRVLESDLSASVFMRQFRSISSGRAEAEAAALALMGQRPDLALWVFQAVTYLANSDGRVTPKEEERLADVAGWLSLS